MMNLHTPPPSDICYQLDPTGDKSLHVTAPNASCLAKHGNRLRLGRLLIGDVALFGTLMVARVATDGYQIYKRTYTFEVALGIIENRLDPSKPKARGKKPKTPRTKTVEVLPIETLPLFAAAKPNVLTLIIPQSVAKSIIRKLSLNTRFLVFDDISLFHESMRLAA